MYAYRRLSLQRMYNCVRRTHTHRQTDTHRMAICSACIESRDRLRIAKAIDRSKASSWTTMYIMDHPRSAGPARLSSTRWKSAAARAAITVPPIDCKLPSLRLRRRRRNRDPFFLFPGSSPPLAPSRDLSLYRHPSLDPLFVDVDRLWAALPGASGKAVIQTWW